MFLSVFTGCKKGENDPALSLLSRKARLSGSWELSSANYTNNYDGDITTYSYDGTLMTITGNGNTDVKNWSEKITINKDGSFTSTETRDYQYYDYNDFEWKTGTYIEAIEGIWFFVDGNKDLDVKSKERVAFQVQKSTTTYPTSNGTETYTNTYSGQSNSQINLILLDELAKKEIIMKYDYSHLNSSTDLYTISGTSTYTQVKD